MRGMDRRLRELERSLSESPWDLELQFATFAETVRAGLLPTSAMTQVFQGRPIQPWQWNPVSYVLLEAERLGRHTEWRAGKVEIEWLREGPIPAWGLDGETVLNAIDGRYGAWNVRRAVGDLRHFDNKGARKVYVGALSTTFDISRLVAGEDLGGTATDRALEFFPSRFVPGLGDRQAVMAKRQQTGIHDPYRHTRMPEGGREDAAFYDPGEVPPPYTGSYPDVFDPQMLLRGFSRVRVSGRGTDQQRSPGAGPLLDVRLIKSVRIMEKRNGKWT